MYKLSYIKDVMGNNYLGIKYHKNEIEPFILDLMDHDPDNFDTLRKNQTDRDNGAFHTTVLNVMEYNSSIKEFGADLFLEKLSGAFSLDIDVDMLGVGTAEGRGNKTYFVVVKSDMLDEIRKSLGHGKKDLHVTIGFDKKDVFGKPKDETTLL